jgi:hypothetical protein
VSPHFVPPLPRPQRGFFSGPEFANRVDSYSPNWQIFTALSGWRSCGVVITKFSGHVVTFRSSPTVLADTPISGSTSTLILPGKPPRAMWSAAMLFGLYRIGGCFTA